MGENKLNSRMLAGRFLGIKEVPLLLGILGIATALSISKSSFLNPGNIHAIFLGSSFELIIAIGMTLLFIMGGFDLSVGSIAGFSGVVLGLCFDAGLGVEVAIIMGILAASLIGFANGVIISKLRVNALITTLAMQMIIRGLIYILTKGVGKTNFPDEFNIIGRATWLGVQTPIYFSLILVIIFSILFARSSWFRQFYFIGGNEEAARLSAIKVDRLRIFAYTFTGLMAGISGILLASRMGGAIPTQGQGMEMTIIAGCVIGGSSLGGGEGSLFGSFLGIFIMALVLNAFNLLGVSIYWQRMILGLILLTAVLGDVLRERKFE
ncbi:MAG TPA: ABC transporter permease [Clostridia bacterium]|nr:ABC transporter permease [Clostridia bacterium]